MIVDEAFGPQRDGIELAFNIEVCTRAHHFFDNFNFFKSQKTLNVLRLVLSGF